LEGDSNTKYFKPIANEKYRNTRIFEVHNGDQIIEGDAHLKQHTTHYYKNLFGPSENNNFVLDESRIDDIPQVSELENEQLVKKICEEEVRKAVFQMEHNKALGPHEFPAEFYQAC
jgi:hypothetical protein